VNDLVFVFLTHMNALQLSARHFRLSFKSPFGIAHGVRNFTDTIYVKATFMDFEGFGEAAVPPYLHYDAEALVKEFHNYFPSQMDGSEAIRKALLKLNHPETLLPKPLRTATDIALHDLFGKLTGRTVRSIFGIGERNDLLCAYTLGISPLEVMREKLSAATGFRLFKLKLGAADDKDRIEAFLSSSDASFCVDANQAWKTTAESIQWINWLKDRGCLFVEQPMPVKMAGEYAQLFRASSLPIILDESLQGLTELEELKEVCHGINVKLLKCGGLEPAVSLVRQANKLGLKVLIGCMSESSCGALAAAQLSAWADWVDLDGPKLISNDPFSGAVYKEGSLMLPAAAGTGAVLEDKSLFSN